MTKHCYNQWKHQTQSRETLATPLKSFCLISGPQTVTKNVCKWNLLLFDLLQPIYCKFQTYFFQIQKCSKTRTRGLFLLRLLTYFASATQLNGPLINGLETACHPTHKKRAPPLAAMMMMMIMIIIVSAYRYIAITNLSIIPVFVEYLRQRLIDFNQIYRHSSVPKNTSPCIY